MYVFHTPFLLRSMPKAEKKMMLRRSFFLRARAACGIAWLILKAGPRDEFKIPLQSLQLPPAF